MRTLTIHKLGLNTPKSLTWMLAAAALSVGSAASAQGIRATVDDVLIRFTDVQPMMSNGHVMVPVRGVFEHLNATVVWDEKSGTVTAQRGTDIIRLPVNENYATMNGREMALDSPARIVNGRTMVPLRFLSESLGAGVEWVASTRTVEINTLAAGVRPTTGRDTIVAHISPTTVIPFSLNTKLTSKTSKVGDRFTATLDTMGDDDYNNLPKGTTLEGRVSAVSAKAGDTPGALGLEFDRVVLPDGGRYRIYGALHGLDEKSVTIANGKMTAKDTAKSDNLKYVGYGAGAGALVSLITKGNVITNSLIGGALGFLFGQLDPKKANDVTLDEGSRFGVRLTNDLAFRIPATPSK